MTKTAMSDSKGRIVCDIEVEGHGCDAFITFASYVDGGEVPEEELDYLTDAYPETVREYAFEAAVGCAESMYEGDR